MRSTSPFRSHTPEAIQGLISRLESENTALVDEINILKTKSRKVHELEEKIELILKQNTQLLGEN